MRKMLCFGTSLVFCAALFAAPVAQARTKMTPTGLTVKNNTGSAVYVNLVLGQPPASPPANCPNLGQQIKTITDPRLKFTSSMPKKTVAFTPQAAGINDKGYYQMVAGETITYTPQTFSCKNRSGFCAPALTFNFFFTPNAYNGNPNNGCGASKEFPNATNLAEGSINFGVNDSAGGGCANADAVDISIVNGVNAKIAFSLIGSQWPFTSGANGALGTNANKQGVYGWAATNCVNNAGYPNPSANCAAPKNAPKATLVNKKWTCKTPKGMPYAPIVGPNGTQYCAELSDSSKTAPQGMCVSQRPGNVTGGTVAISFNGFI